MVLFGKFPKIVILLLTLNILDLVCNNICPHLLALLRVVNFVLINSLFRIQVPYIVMHYSTESALKLPLLSQQHHFQQNIHR